MSERSRSTRYSENAPLASGLLDESVRTDRRASSAANECGRHARRDTAWESGSRHADHNRTRRCPGLARAERRTPPLSVTAVVGDGRFAALAGDFWTSVRVTGVATATDRVATGTASAGSARVAAAGRSWTVGGAHTVLRIGQTKVFRALAGLPRRGDVDHLLRDGIASNGWDGTVQWAWRTDHENRQKENRTNDFGVHTSSPFVGRSPRRPVPWRTTSSFGLRPIQAAFRMCDPSSPALQRLVVGATPALM